MINEISICKLEYFKKKGGELTTDANGKLNVILVPIAGKIPNQAQVLSGSVAVNAGFLNNDGSMSGNLFMVLVTEKAADPTYGRQFGVQKLDTVSGKDILGLRKELGEGLVVVTKVKEANEEGNDEEGNALTLNTSKLEEEQTTETESEAETETEAETEKEPAKKVNPKTPVAEKK